MQVYYRGAKGHRAVSAFVPIARKQIRPATDPKVRHSSSNIQLLGGKWEWVGRRRGEPSTRKGKALLVSPLSNIVIILQGTNDVAGQQLANVQRAVAEIKRIQGEALRGHLDNPQGQGLPGNCKHVGC